MYAAVAAAMLQPCAETQGNLAGGGGSTAQPMQAGACWGAVLATLIMNATRPATQLRDSGRLYSHKVLQRGDLSYNLVRPISSEQGWGLAACTCGDRESWLSPQGSCSGVTAVTSRFESRDCDLEAQESGPWTAHSRPCDVLAWGWDCDLKAGVPWA